MKRSTLYIFAALLLIGGCSSSRREPPASKSTASSLAGAWENGKATTRAIAKGIPHADDYGKGVLEGGLESGIATLKNIEEGQAQNDWFVGAYWSNTNELNGIKEDPWYKRGQWVKRMKWWLGLGSAAVIIALIAIPPGGVTALVAGVFMFVKRAIAAFFAFLAGIKIGRESLKQPTPPTKKSSKKAGA